MGMDADAKCVRQETLREMLALVVEGASGVCNLAWHMESDMVCPATAPDEAGPCDSTFRGRLADALASLRQTRDVLTRLETQVCVPEPQPPASPTRG